MPVNLAIGISEWSINELKVSAKGIEVMRVDRVDWLIGLTG
jgi:hypothetical protein